jgi:hypothetical protein
VSDTPQEAPVPEEQGTGCAETKVMLDPRPFVVVRIEGMGMTASRALATIMADCVKGPNMLVVSAEPPEVGSNLKVTLNEDCGIWKKVGVGAGEGWSVGLRVVFVVLLCCNSLRSCSCNTDADDGVTTTCRSLISTPCALRPTIGGLPCGTGTGLLITARMALVMTC